MRLPFIMICILFVVNLLSDIIINKNVKRRFQNRWQTKTCIAISIVTWLILLIAVSMPRRDSSADLQPIMWLLYTFLSIFIPKIVYSVFCLIDKIPSLWKAKHLSTAKFVGRPLALIMFIAIWWGALVTRSNIQTTHTTVAFDNLPEAFDGFRIIQISDIHAGTWGSDTTFLLQVVDSINSLSPDVILFTGDIVNRQTSELFPFVNTLSKLKATHGVFSVLGNHDYGDYMDWETPRDKELNKQLLIDQQEKMGWKMLNNQHQWINRNADSIAIIGVENWGEPPFSVYGNLPEAYPNLTDQKFKILLTHNPEHWSREVVKISNIDLSLSGHTHGMQLIFQIGDWKWSPAVWKYKQWGGLYSAQNISGKESKLYVNIGLGEVALPFRLGATPEITVLTLKRK